MKHTQNVVLNTVLLLLPIGKLHLLRSMLTMVQQLHSLKQYKPSTSAPPITHQGIIRNNANIRVAALVRSVRRQCQWPLNFGTRGAGLCEAEQGYPNRHPRVQC